MALRLAAGLAMLPLFASPRAFAQGGGPFIPPSGEMIYRRHFDRYFADGTKFCVRRDFSVRFTAVADGFELAGLQVSVQATAPEALAQYALLEEQREEVIFPLALDRGGRIVAGEERGPSAQFAIAVEGARRRHGDMAGEVDALVEALHATGSLLTAQLPPDLFAPQEPRREERERILLPWGDTGEVETRFEAECDPATGLMRVARREVVTRLGADERRSGEEWTLFPA